MGAEARACPGCGADMLPRTNPTPEQAWCGTWFDHVPVPLGGCTRFPTLLKPSAALLQQDADLRAEHESRLEGL